MPAWTWRRLGERIAYMGRDRVLYYQIFPPLPESEFVQHPDQPLALRVSSRLLVGITRVHQKQAHYVYGELDRSARHQLMVQIRPASWLDCEVSRSDLQSISNTCGSGSTTCQCLPTP